MDDDVEWDAAKADANLAKHGVDFADALRVLYDEDAVTRQDDHPLEERFVTIGMDFLGRCLVVVYTWLGRPHPDDLGTKGHPQRGAAVRRRRAMKDEYDFSEGKRGPVLPTPPGKTRITIRIDDEVLDWFRAQVHAAGGGNYQSLINAALREHIQRRQEPLEDTLRRVVREELRRSA